MGSVNVKFPDEMEEKMDEFIEETGLFVNRSELVRDAVRRRLEENAHLSASALERIDRAKRELERGEGRSIDEVRDDIGLDE